jgi:hypothetical protein
MKDVRDPSAVLIGGVNIDLGRRYYGIERLRATWPVGRLKIAQGQASLSAKSLGTLPRDLPLPLLLTPATACVLELLLEVDAVTVASGGMILPQLTCTCTTGWDPTG